MYFFFAKNAYRRTKCSCSVDIMVFFPLRLFCCCEEDRVFQSKHLALVYFLNPNVFHLFSIWNFIANFQLATYISDFKCICWFGTWRHIPVQISQRNRTKVHYDSDGKQSRFWCNYRLFYFW